MTTITLEQVIVETCTFEGEHNMIEGERASQKVARVLCIDTSFDRLGILACHALRWVNHDPETLSAQLTIIYRYPTIADPHRKPLTLRSVLRHDDDVNHPRTPDMPIRVRLRLAREVANAVLFVHVAGLVHKDIRPENILIFFPKSRTSDNHRNLWSDIIARIAQLFCDNTVR